MLSSKGCKSLTFHKYLYKNPKGYRVRLDGDFHRYDQRTNSLLFDKDDQGNTIIKFRPDCHENQGIEWIIPSNNKDDTAPVEVKIDLRPFLGINNDLRAVTYRDMNEIIVKFNSIANSISRLLGTFENYRLVEINYCCYLYFNELYPSSMFPPELGMYLIDRAKMLPIYDPSLQISIKPGYPKCDPNRYYVLNSALRIDCYRKKMEILKQEEDIIYFECQCKCHSTVDIYGRSQHGLSTCFNLYEDILTDKVCNEIIDYYLTTIVGRGKWYSMQCAVDKIKECSIDYQTESLLITGLAFVSECQDITLAAERCRNSEYFWMTLHDLDRMGINPVTLPKECIFDCAPTLMEAYQYAYMNDFEERFALYQMEEHLEYMAEGERSKKNSQ